MPEYAGFSISLVSQYDAATIPEDHVRVVTTPTLRSLHLDGICESPGLTQHPDKTFSDLHERESATVIETWIPTFQSSQFWICYDCPPPPDRDDDEGEHEEVRYYYFKLFVSGKCILSWGIGEQDNWRGKTMFGLFDGGRDFEGRRIVEKRGLFFPSTNGSGAEGFEIKVLRAKARRREPARYQSLSEVAGGGAGFRELDLELTSLGKAQRGERQRFWTYALLDAKDEPWVTFRYRFEADEDDTVRVESMFLSSGLEDTTSAIAAGEPEAEESIAEVTESSLWIGLEQSTPPSQGPSTFVSNAMATTRRLSFPPRNLLLSSTSRAEPSSPIKQQASASDDDLTRPRAQNVQYHSIAMAERTFSHRTTGLRKPEWTAVRGPSPAGELGVVDGPRGEVVVPAHRKSTSGSSGLLKSVVASALRRKEAKNG